MILRKEITMESPFGPKTIRVCRGSICEYEETVDILTVSAFRRNYVPVIGTMIGSLQDEKGISVENLSDNPALDLRDFCGCWVSEEMLPTQVNRNVRRIGCLELGRVGSSFAAENLLSRIQSYFRMLDLLGVNHIPVSRVTMPFVGTGNQWIDPKMMVVPLISETLQFLKRSPWTESVTFVERSETKANILVNTLERSYAILQEQEKSVAKKEEEAKPLVFISYSSGDVRIADLLCRKLEEAGMDVWYAPRDISSGNYASAIVGAISRSTHFVAIISRNSMNSEHVLNEVDLAFEQLKRGIVLLPLRVDDEDLRAEFNYYLKRQQWTDAHKPPMEERIEEFIRKVFRDPQQKDGFQRWKWPAGRETSEETGSRIL